MRVVEETVEKVKKRVRLNTVEYHQLQHHVITYRCNNVKDIKHVLNYVNSLLTEAYELGSFEAKTVGVKPYKRSKLAANAFNEAFESFMGVAPKPKPDKSCYEVSCSTTICGYRCCCPLNRRNK